MGPVYAIAYKQSTHRSSDMVRLLNSTLKHPKQSKTPSPTHFIISVLYASNTVRISHRRRRGYLALGRDVHEGPLLGWSARGAAPKARSWLPTILEFNRE